MDCFAASGLEPVVWVDDPKDPDTHVYPGGPVHPPGPRSGLRILRPDRASRRGHRTGAGTGFSLIGVEQHRAVLARDAVGDRAETHLDRSLDHLG